MQSESHGCFQSLERQNKFINSSARAQFDSFTTMEAIIQAVVNFSRVDIKYIKISEPSHEYVFVNRPNKTTAC